MNRSLLIQQLYSNSSGKYLKFKVRLEKAMQSGRFYRFSKRKQASLYSRLKKLYERLKSWQAQLRIAGAGVALASTLSISNPAQAQNTLGPFTINSGANPLPPPYFVDRPRIAVVDIDNDGDLDVFAGTQSGTIEFFRNTAGPTTVRRFTKVTGSSNPLDGVNKGLRAAPAFTDVDGDGDFDMLLGIEAGFTYFFRNTGTRANAVFTEQTGASNPFDGITGIVSKYGVREEAIPVFVDIDKDSDVDLFIGSTYQFGPNTAVVFYENTGGSFVSSSHNLNNYLRSGFSNTAMTFADLDNNGELDVIASDGFGALRTFLEASSEFNEQFGTWNPGTRTGNPMSGFYFYYGSPVLADFDGDGDLDLLVGQADSDYTSVKYFQNTDGAYTFKERSDLNISPMGGVDVGEEAAPVFIDLDNDGDLDAVLGAKYNGGAFNTTPEILVYIRNANREFIPDLNHPLRNTTGLQDVIPVFVDIDNDGDQDFFYTHDYDVDFFRNNSGSFAKEVPSLFPTLNSSNARELSLAFVDVDNDGDLDAIFGNDRSGQPRILYFQNTGTASAPVFTQAAPPAPFSNPIFQFNPNVSAVDLDNDGDTDIALSETYYFQSGAYGNRTRVRFFENKGDGTFTEAVQPILTEGLPQLSFTSFQDLDGDGDLDAFLGNGSNSSSGVVGQVNGQVNYFENTNPPPVTTLPATTLAISGGTATILVPTLALADSDNDRISKAIVSIVNFRVGEEVLSFSPQAGITGSFNSTTGILTLTGLASVTAYHTALQAVTYQFIGTTPTTSGRSVSGRTKAITLNRSISFTVFDNDLTNPLPKTLAVQISFPDPNQPPVINAPVTTIAIGNSVDIDLTTFITDPDNNLDVTSLKVIQLASSGALVTVNGLVVTLDYTGTDFAGPDQFTIEVCDLAGACTQKVVNLQVEGEVVVYNGISPNGDGPNDYFQLKNIVALEPNNKVSIYTRWGDKVFEIENYDNDQRKFVGLNDKGNELTSGVYFYRIEFTSGKKELTGYLTIKR